MHCYVVLKEVIIHTYINKSHSKPLAVPLGTLVRELTFSKKEMTYFHMLSNQNKGLIKVTSRVSSNHTGHSASIRTIVLKPRLTHCLRADLTQVIFEAVILGELTQVSVDIIGSCVQY